jgi:hypothetical protein
MVDIVYNTLYNYNIGGWWTAGFCDIATIVATATVGCVMMLHDGGRRPDYNIYTRSVRMYVHALLVAS